MKKGLRKAINDVAFMPTKHEEGAAHPNVCAAKGGTRGRGGSVGSLFEPGREDGNEKKREPASH